MASATAAHRHVRAFLPSLKEISETFDNVLCETVIMHLPAESITPAVLRLQNLLRPGGVLYLSWRVTEGEDARHTDGRLYAAFTPEKILRHFSPEGILHCEDRLSASSGKRVCRLISKKH